MTDLPPAYSEFVNFTGTGQSGTEKEAKWIREGMPYQQTLPVIVSSHDTGTNYSFSAGNMREINSVYPDEARIVNVKLNLRNTGTTPMMISKVMHGDVNIMPQGGVTHLFMDGKRSTGSHCIIVGDTIELDMPIKWSKDELSQLTRRGKDPYARVCTHMPVARVDSTNPPVVYLPVVKMCEGEEHMVKLAFQAFKAGIKPKRDKNGGPFVYPIEAKSWEQCVDDIRQQMEIEGRGLQIMFSGDPGTVQISMMLAYNCATPEWRRPGMEGGIGVIMPIPSAARQAMFIPSATIDNDSINYMSSADLWTKKKNYKRFMRKTDPLLWLTAMGNNQEEDVYTALCKKTGESGPHEAMTSFMANAIRYYTRMADQFEPGSMSEHLSLRNIDETGYSKILQSKNDETTIAKCMSLMEAMLAVAINSKKGEFGRLKEYGGEENPMPFLSHWIDGCPVLHDAVLGQYAVKVKV